MRVRCLIFQGISPFSTTGDRQLTPGLPAVNLDLWFLNEKRLSWRMEQCSISGDGVQSLSLKTAGHFGRGSICLQQLCICKNMHDRI